MRKVSNDVPVAHAARRTGLASTGQLPVYGRHRPTGGPMAKKARKKKARKKSAANHGKRPNS